MPAPEQLIKSCRNGEKAAQYELVKTYSGMLMTVCRRYSRDDATAKDILQETFIRIFRHIGSYRPTGSFEAWMRRIAANCALKWIDRKHFRMETQPEDLPSAETGPEIYDRFDLEEVIGQIRELSPSLRTVLNLYAIEGYSHAEIGKMLGIAESSSRANLMRARVELTKRLQAPSLKNQTA